MMAVLAKSIPTVWEDTANMEDLDGDLVAMVTQYETPTTAIA
jgi:hypothetical protein